VTFVFSSNETGSTFLCKLDKHPFAACVAPRTLRRLKPGIHTFQVVAIDAAANRDATPAIRNFRIKKKAGNR